MRKALKSFEIIKKMYEYFVKKYRDLEPKLMICENEDFDNVEKALEDFEWLKEHIGFQLLDHLSTSDKIKLLEIMGVEYNQGDWHIKL